MDEITPAQIRDWLKQIGKDRQWLAKQTDQSEATVNNWLAKNKPRAINPHALKKIRDLMDAPVVFNPKMPMSIYAAAQAAAEAEGKDIDEWAAEAFLAKLAKAGVKLLLFFALCSSLFRWAETGDAASAAIMGLSDAAVLAGKALAFVASCGVELLAALANC